MVNRGGAARKAAPRKATAAKKAAPMTAEQRAASKAARADRRRTEAGVPDAPREYKEWLSKQIMAFPEGCGDGKRRFMEKVGLPLPPAVAIVNNLFRFTLGDGEYRDSGGYLSITITGRNRIVREVRELLPEEQRSHMGSNGQHLRIDVRET